MWAQLRALFAEPPERAGRRLARDAERVARLARDTYRPELVATIADRTRAELATAAQLLAASPQARGTVLDAMRSRHREARRAGDAVGLTSWTFVIIHTRATALGEHGRAAREAVERFVADTVASAQAP